jgi:cell division cycle 2-like protein
MASKSKSSRWAETEEDAALVAQQKREKEEKKRLKAEKAKRQQEEALRAKAAAASQPNGSGDGHDDGPPAKRRRLSPQPDSAQGPTTAADAAGQPKLLRFEGGGFGKCRSVENYDKLNDIEEGAYGWVSRAKELATGKIVALKRLKIDPKDRSGLPVTGLREIQILRDCDHRNVVRLKEVVVGDDTRKIEK